MTTPSLLSRGTRGGFCRIAASAGEDAPGEALFQDLHHGGGRPLFRFADQQVKVLRHDHVSDDHKLVTLAGVLQDFQEKIAMLGVS